MPTELKKQRLYGPDVTLHTRGDRQVVVKTYRQRAWPVRLAGALLLAWERYIYSRLAGMEGIPPLVTPAAAQTLVTVFMGGENLRETRRQPDARYFTALEELIANMHARGVVHLDLRNRRNYGIDEDGLPYLVDFASSLYLPGRLGRVLERIDWMGMLKVKGKLAPQLLSEAECQRLELGNALSRVWLPGRLIEMLRGLRPRRRCQ